MKVTVNQKTCIGCGMCVGISDEIFNMDYETNKASVNKNVDFDKKGTKERVVESVKMCPVGAIEISSARD